MESHKIPLLEIVVPGFLAPGECLFALGRTVATCAALPEHHIQALPHEEHGDLSSSSDAHRLAGLRSSTACSDRAAVTERRLPPSRDPQAPSAPTQLPNFCCQTEFGDLESALRGEELYGAGGFFFLLLGAPLQKQKDSRKKVCSVCFGQTRG